MIKKENMESCLAEEKRLEKVEQTREISFNVQIAHLIVIIHAS